MVLAVLNEIIERHMDYPGASNAVAMSPWNLFRLIPGPTVCDIKPLATTGKQDVDSTFNGLSVG
jgi:hypothetical protein